MTNTKYLYHGTNAKALPQILTKGLQPRKYTNVNNRWSDFPSRSDMIYLTRLYAPYFGFSAISEDDNEIAIIRVRIDDLDEQLLFPDEDYVAQGINNDGDFWTENGIDEDAPLTEKTEFAREVLHLLGSITKHSIEELGNCAYQGIISPRQFDEVVVYDTTQNSFINQMLADPTITILNALYCGEKYNILTEWFFESKTESDFDRMMMNYKPTDPRGLERWQRTMQDCWLNRDSLETINRHEIQEIMGGTDASA